MLVIESKGAKGKSFDKKRLKRYWKRVYPKEYTDVLVGKKLTDLLSKEAQQMKSVPLKGIIRKTDDGFIYVDISNNVINGLFSLIDEEGIEKPPYSDEEYDNIGAHISVMKEDELKEDEEFSDFGKEITFKLDKFFSVEPKTWDEVERVWCIKVVSPDLEKLRKKYGLAKKFHGHDFHITVAVKKAE